MAHASDEYLRRRLGKMGFVLRTFARGEDATPVKRLDPGARDVIREVKSYGNGLTAPHPIASAGDARALVWLLSESVAQRMREDGVRARTVSVGARSDAGLAGYSCQAKLPRPSAATRHVARAAWGLLASRERFSDESPIRALHVRASDLVVPDDGGQPRLLDVERDWEGLDRCIDGLRRRHGNKAVVRGCELLDPSLASLDVKDENTVCPVSRFHR